MKTSDYSTKLIVEQTPKKTFDAINNVSAWWSEDMAGSNNKLNGSFTVSFGEVFISMKVTELIPAKKITWLVTDCNKPWLKDPKEWVNTNVIFDISVKDDKTRVSFAHHGLVTQLECYDVCSNAWTEYIHQSLFSLITKGKGKPTPKAHKKVSVK